MRRAIRRLRSSRDTVSAAVMGPLAFSAGDDLEPIGPAWETCLSILQGAAMSNFEYKTDPLDEMEDVVGVFYGGRGQVGQQFVVTNRRLLIGPLDVGMALEIDAYIVNKAAAGTGDLLKNVLSHYAPMSPKNWWLRHVVDVQPTNNASWLKAPGLEIRTDTDQVLKLGIVATRATMSRDPKNNAVRDRAVEVIRSAVQSAKAAPPKPV
jgi:hypothetical protein